MKKFAVIAAAAGMFALAACGEKAAEEATTEAPATEAVAEEAAPAAEGAMTEAAPAAEGAAEAPAAEGAMTEEKK
ncbi:MAG: hypothetical protein SFV20_11090 [Sphingopyxis sp.]|nr:hypothetical protein [Sphingopyxis sp.]